MKRRRAKPMLLWAMVHRETGSIDYLNVTGSEKRCRAMVQDRPSSGWRVARIRIAEVVRKVRR